MLVSMKQRPKTRASAQRITRERRLQFVVKFAQLDLSVLRRGDWLNLREDLAWFLHGVRYGPDFDFGRDEIPLAHHDLVAHPTDLPTSDVSTDEALVDLQAEIRTLLTALVSEADDGPGGVSPFVPVQVGLRVVELRPGQKVLVAEGGTRDLFLMLVHMLLWEERRESLRRCAACGTIFYRHGHQDYCSRPCMTRVAQRRWRERHDAAVPAS
jgi:hypothetical protein